MFCVVMVVVEFEDLLPEVGVVSSDPCSRCSSSSSSSSSCSRRERTSSSYKSLCKLNINKRTIAIKQHCSMI